MEHEDEAPESASWDMLPDALALCIVCACSPNTLRQLSLCSKELNAQCSPRLEAVYAAYLRVRTATNQRAIDVAIEKGRDPDYLRVQSRPPGIPALCLKSFCCSDQLCYEYAMTHRLFPRFSIQLHRGFITDSGVAALLSAFKRNGKYSFDLIPQILHLSLENTNITSVAPFVDFCSHFCKRPALDVQSTFSLGINLVDNKLSSSRPNVDAMMLLHDASSLIPLPAIQSAMKGYYYMGEATDALAAGLTVEEAGARPTSASINITGTPLAAALERAAP